MTPHTSYTRPLRRDRRAAIQRRLHHLALAAGVFAFGILTAAVTLDVALTLTADLARPEQGAGW
jgi:hypothetical protein